MKNPFSLVKDLFVHDSEHEEKGRRRDARIISGTHTEFIFCNRKFGAMIVDASISGMKINCDIRLGIGSIIHFIDPAVSGKIVWRDDQKKLMGIKFIQTESGAMADDDLPSRKAS
ncbi:MAG TPA: PilZ domain-containing protein [Dissulfurispiraceae bacterium]|nr:PilZ domain-containing protein [Dissulfurispiraceae bacterium]